MLVCTCFTFACSIIFWYDLLEIEKLCFASVLFHRSFNIQILSQITSSQQWGSSSCIYIYHVCCLWTYDVGVLIELGDKAQQLWHLFVASFWDQSSLNKHILSEYNYIDVMYRLVQLVLSAVKYLADQSLSDEEVRRRQNRTQDESADCWNGEETLCQKCKVIKDLVLEIFLSLLKFTSIQIVCWLVARFSFWTWAWHNWHSRLKSLYWVPISPELSNIWRLSWLAEILGKYHYCVLSRQSLSSGINVEYQWYIVLHPAIFIYSLWYSAAGIPGAYHEREEKTVYGQVTHLYQDYGLIDNYIYFTKEYVKQEGNLKVRFLLGFATIFTYKISHKTLSYL